jgi:hypothetical protein
MDVYDWEGVDRDSEDADAVMLRCVGINERCEVSARVVGWRENASGVVMMGGMFSLPWLALSAVLAVSRISGATSTQVRRWGSICCFGLPVIDFTPPSVCRATCV